MEKGRGVQTRDVEDDAQNRLGEKPGVKQIINEEGLTIEVDTSEPNEEGEYEDGSKKLFKNIKKHPF